MAWSFQLFLSSLFRQHHSDAVRFASRLVGGRENGEEVVQNAWLSLVARKNEAPIEHPKTYFFTATRNAAIDFTMRERREWANRVDFESLSEADVADSTVERYEQRRQVASLAVFLNELPPSCRQAFLMHKVEGYTHSEVAEKLGVSTSMVEKHVVRALIHCRDLVRSQSGS